MVDRHHPGKAPTALLQALRDGSCQTIEQLEASLDLTRRQVSDAAANLLRRDYLIRTGLGCYKLTEAGARAAVAGEIITSGPRRPHGTVRIQSNTIRDRAWRAMRIRRRFTVPDLVADARTTADAAPLESIGRYVRMLRKAGFLVEGARRVQGVAPSSNGYKIWCLVRNTGPLAPVVRSITAAVHDPNTGEDLPCSRR